jgi:hypothetical protein
MHDFAVAAFVLDKPSFEPVKVVVVVKVVVQHVNITSEKPHKAALPTIPFQVSLSKQR